MTHLETELAQLKSAVDTMMALTISQLSKAKEAFQTHDLELAQEVVSRENRVNALELSIDRDCEDMFALFNPVASDLKFVIAVLKIISELERIADHAEGIAQYILDQEEPFDTSLIETIQLDEMLNIALAMSEDVRASFTSADTKIARRIFTKDKQLNEINHNSSRVITAYLSENAKSTRSALLLFSMVRKLERVGDLSKNIAEHIIYFSEAKVVRHSK